MLEIKISSSIGKVNPTWNNFAVHLGMQSKYRITPNKKVLCKIHISFGFFSYFFRFVFLLYFFHCNIILRIFVTPCYMWDEKKKNTQSSTAPFWVLLIAYVYTDTDILAFLCKVNSLAFWIELVHDIFEDAWKTRRKFRTQPNKSNKNARLSLSKGRTSLQF